MKNYMTSLIVGLLTVCAFGQSTQEKEFKTVDNVSLSKKVFTIKVAYDSDDFILKICQVQKCSETGEFSHAIDSTFLSQAIINFVNSELDNSVIDSLITDDPERKYLNGLANRIKEHIKKDKESKKSEAQKTTEAIDNAKDIHAAEVVLNKYIIISSDSVSDLDKKIYFKNKDTSRKYQNDTLFLKEAVVQFFNNKATSVFLQATLKHNDTTSEDLEFYNSAYSIPLRAFIHYDNASIIVKTKNTLKAWTNNGQEIEIHVNDIFDFKNVGSKNEGNFGFSIANQRFRVANGEGEPNSFKVSQRRFFDFFTAIIHSDVMGANNENSNSLINAQASMLMPMNLGNWGKFSALRQFKLNVNVALSNSFENDSRFIGFSNGEEVDHFDLLKKNNLNGTLSLDFLSYESKGWFGTWSLGYNVGFYRTGYSFTDTVSGDTDVVTTGQVSSLSHGPYINLEFRPQDNFGVDVMFSIENFSVNDNIEIDDRDFRDEITMLANTNKLFGFKHNVINVATNLYWLTNPEKSVGGVYARIAAAYHLPTDSVFPQIMVGYATNLTSFVNRFKSDKPDTN